MVGVAFLFAKMCVSLVPFPLKPLIVGDHLDSEVTVTDDLMYCPDTIHKADWTLSIVFFLKDIANLFGNHRC